MSLLTDRVLRRIGLNGKGILPLIMGFSCVTMAVLTTRTLDSNKQRIIATLLLVLTIPCAPLLGIMLVMLSKLSIWATVTLFGVLALQFLVVGAAANFLIPGRRAEFFLELPPLRAPRLRNALVKSGHQLIWFLKEAIPYFMIGALLLFGLEQAGLLDSLRAAFRPISEHMLGLPGESADVFLMTMVRREAGAALLAQMAEAGMFNGNQAVITLVVMTLMVPCINTVLVLYKERGMAVATAILLFTMFYSIFIGALVHASFTWLGVSF